MFTEFLEHRDQLQKERTEREEKDALFQLLQDISTKLDDLSGAKQVEVTNFDEVAAAFHNTIIKLNKALKGVTPSQSQLKIPSSIKINNLSEMKVYFDGLGRILAKLASPQVTVMPTPVNIPDIDFKPLADAIVKSLEVNLNKIRTNGKTRPLAVRLSDGQEFIKKLDAVMERQEIAFAGFNENMRLKNAQGTPINPATSEDFAALTLAINNLGGGTSILAITALVNSVNAVEIGSTVTSTILTWTLNKAVTSQSFNQSIGTLDAALRTFTHNRKPTMTKVTITPSKFIFAPPCR